MSRGSGKPSLQLFSKINILDIIEKHLGTLKDYQSARYSLFDIGLFFILPLLFSIVFVYWLKFSLSKDLIGILINVFSIFAGLLFNLLVLVYDVISKIVKPKATAQSNMLKIDLVEQIYSNISFEILLSLFNVLLLAGAGLIRSKFVNNAVSVIIFWLVIVFALTLLMVLKRVHKLLSYEIEQQKSSIQP